MNDFLERLEGYAPALVDGAIVTLLITVCTMVLATIIGLAVAVLRTTAPRVVRLALGFYVETVRNTPELVLLFLVYFSLPQFGLILPALFAAIFVFSIHYGAFLSEVFRGGIKAVSARQWEAGRVLQLSTTRIWVSVVLPQAVRAVLPTWGNYLQTVLKASALAGTITVNELFFRVNDLASRNFQYLELFSLAAAVYLLLSLFASILQRVLENRFDYQKRALA